MEQTHYTRYRGDFVSREGVLWRVEILQEADAPFSTVGELTFDADDALSIDWAVKDKEEVICGSSAILQIESPGDRTYIDLYTERPGSIKLKVYRNLTELYWSGTLDPEFYEEPYERADKYMVQLTFSDFGILDRFRYDMDGMVSLDAILRRALTLANLMPDTDIDYSLISTRLLDLMGQPDAIATPERLMARSENFYDEDGEPQTYRDVIAGILQPLALRIIQRSGRIYVYDLNAIAMAGANSAVEWTGDSSTLSVDKVAQKVKVTFSPYADVLQTAEVEYTGSCIPSDTDLYTPDHPDHSYYWSGFNNQKLPWIQDPAVGVVYDPTGVRFAIFHGKTGSGVELMRDNAEYFKILPLHNGPSECTGIVHGFIRNSDNVWVGEHPFQIESDKATELLMQSPLVFIDHDAGAWVRVQLEMLLDAHYNPFSGDNGDNSDNEAKQLENVMQAFVPVAIELLDEDGNPLYYFSNRGLFSRQMLPYSPFLGCGIVEGHLTVAHGEWVAGGAVWGDAWLSYYDTGFEYESKDSKTKLKSAPPAAVGGWKTNRQTFGMLPPNHVTIGKDWTFHDQFKDMEAGEYIPSPPVSGYIRVTVFCGALLHTYDPWGSHTDLIRWHLYKLPKVELIDMSLESINADETDIEYQGLINADAKEELEIDTICGTCPATQEPAMPGARGVYYEIVHDGTIRQLQYVSRRGVTKNSGKVEELLIGTLYSQYAARKTMLTGECRIIPDGLPVATEPNQADRLFMIKGESQNLITDTSDITLVELVPDEYNKTELFTSDTNEQ